MHELELISASLAWPGFQECINSWGYPVKILRNDKTEQSILQSYQRSFEESKANILGYVHDDVMVYESGWKERVLKEFEDESVGIVGFGGATRHGAPDLYSGEFCLPKLARGGFASNMRSAESHGKRFTGERDVAVLDGFTIFVRRSILAKVGGWNLNSGYFMYCEWLCCEARRQGYRIRLVGVDCEHLGGKSSTMVQLTDDFKAVHRWLWENNRDVLPAEVA